MSVGPCLCIVFNHPFPGNIPLLEKIYRGRFPDMKFLVPFEAGSESPDVIPVYRGSYTHQGFVTDAFHVLKDVDCSHFIFLQDDVMLNPEFDADTIMDRLGCGPGDGFVAHLESLDLDVGGWHWILGILWKLYYPRNLLSGTGVDSLPSWLSYLPPLDEAMARAERHGVRLPRVTRRADSLGPDSVVAPIAHFGTGDPRLVRGLNEMVVESLFATAPGDVIEFPYPFALTAWGADFYAVPKSRLKTFAHYVGVMAAAGLFAEISVGTGLILTCDAVRTQWDRGMKLQWVWDENRADRVQELIKLFDEGYAAVHPVKLSKLGDVSPFARNSQVR